MKAKFLLSTLTEFPTLKDPKGKFLPEIAMAGKSNVGKSSLINNWIGYKKLAKTSGTPGKTQLLNFFVIDEKFVLVDLPGYGFAKAPQAEIEKWSNAIDTYLNNRPNLKLILLLIDSRRDICEEDQSMIDWAKHKQIPILLILTKSDKLSTAEKNAILQKHKGATLYSTTKNVGKADLERKIGQILWD